MKPKVLVTREVFQEVLDFLSRHFEVSANQSDVPMDAETLAQALADKHGALTTLTERIDAALLARCPRLKVAIHRLVVAAFAVQVSSNRAPL